MDAEYLIHDTLQLKAVSNPVRMRMLEHLIAGQHTATQLGALLEMAPSRAHYHLKQLEAAGLCRLVEQRVQAGVIEKFYRATARQFRIARTVQSGDGPSPPPDPAAKAALPEVTSRYVGQVERRGGALGEALLLRDLTLHLNPQRYERMRARLHALLLEFESDTRDTRPGLRQYHLLLVSYPEDEAKG